jgi:uncharacterized protein YkwD
MRPDVLRPALVRPSKLRAVVVAVTALLALAGATGTTQAATAAQPVLRGEASVVALDEFEDQLLVEVNRVRRAHDRRPIRVADGCVDRMAETWGEHLALTGLFEHRDQNQVIRQCDVTWAGENLVRGTGLTPEAMVRAWMDSPGHRVILLNSRARRAGVAVTQDLRGRLVGVLNVARAD